MDSAEKKTIPAKGKALIDTQISIAVPAGTYGRVAPRSGLGVSHRPITLCFMLKCSSASKFMIDTGAGVIDADYRGIVMVLLFNHSDADFEGKGSLHVPLLTSDHRAVNEGDRVAQLIIEQIRTPEVIEVQDLDETLRGVGGFGSTGGHGSL
jgi:dUTP pyrophosphatase